MAVQLIVRDQCERFRKTRFRTRSGYSGEGVLSGWRRGNPLTDVTVSPYLASMYKSEVAAYVEGRITRSSFEYKEGTDFMYTADGSLVFQFNGVTPVENYNYTNNDAVLSAGGVKQ